VRTGRERSARAFDEEVYPLFGQRFADMLLASLPPGPRTSVLEVGCASGTLTAELAHRLGKDARIVAVDGSPALIELARSRVVAEEHAGRRVFFRTHAPATKLPFADGAFDLLLTNVPLADQPDLAAAINDWTRVTRPGGVLLLGTPVRGTWSEFLDLLREALVRTRLDAAIAALDAYIAATPEPDTVVHLLEAAGLVRVGVELRRWELVFRSAREFFYAPVIEQGPLPRWKDIVGGGAPMQEAFFAVKDAIDTYFAGRAFTVSVVGARFRADRV